ncbi:hypothetical protein A8B82_09695 [Sulfitobacter sp. EhC04]|uniref:helix-turn-helix transcriptional regulator n=1 Tax=Sulfitobacter sp. EhC04 TaxID=1849168 RepID=UPI0007F493AE|nr:helix-turn-helix transcriptional regulator [Sulfitobacter sp. EhC04]OAN78629.1 hypothetical protein A8B82_09695 [Sulfitobacter sp. EhC04]
MTAMFDILEVDPYAEVGLNDMTEVITEIGLPQFPRNLLGAINKLIGVDYCVCYRLRNYEIREISAAGLLPSTKFHAIQKDIHNVKRQMMTASHVTRVRTYSSDAPMAGRSETSASEILALARVKQDVFCLKLVRSDTTAALSQGDIEKLQPYASLILASVAKHAELMNRKVKFAPALSVIEDVEDCLSDASSLSPREVEVCARILSGMTSNCIASDLGIGKESVMTYRKRAYTRLELRGQRELLVWYLEIWSDWTKNVN